MKQFFYFSLLVLLAGTSAATPPKYTIERLGFFAGANVDSSSSPVYLNEQGQVLGVNYRYSGAVNLGKDAWLYTGTSTILPGFTGAGYEKSDGYRFSDIQALNEQGQALGSSDRYSGTTDLGRDAWLYTGTSTILLGFTGVGYESSTGYRASIPSLLNDGGQAAGYNFRRIPNLSDAGVDSWLYTGISTVQLGFTGPGYVRSDGYRVSYVHYLNDQGQAGGYSNRYSGIMGLGYDAWLYTGTSTILLGFTGAGYEKSDGYRYSDIGALNDQGQALGYSKRYSGATEMGADAWLYTGTSTIQLGLTGAGYERSDGYRSTAAGTLNDQGQATGTSQRYSGTTGMGQDAWLYAGSSTIQIGLTGPAFEQSNGGRYSWPTQINEQGQVIGSSNRYAVVTDGSFAGRGRDAWLYTGTSTILLGLTDANHERNDSVRISELKGLNNQGQVIGSTNRYIGATSAGQDAWFYDPTLNQTFNLSPSVRPSDGYANSNVAYLNEDGVAVGSYELFDQNTSASLGPRAFYFTVADGFQDLGPLVEDLSEAGWSTLGANKVNNAGDIIGTGTLPGMTGNAAYLLRPVSQVQMNVDPWSTANQVKPNSPDAAIMVAILGESVATGGAVDFDGSQIDPASLKFGIGEAPVFTGPWVADGNSDSNPDMLVGFRTGDSAIACGDTEVMLKGKTFAGAPFEATDTIQTIDCETGGCHP